LIPKGRTIWIADAHRDDGKRYVVRSDEKLTAFVELEVAIRGFIRVPQLLRHCEYVLGLIENLSLAAAT